MKQNLKCYLACGALTAALCLAATGSTPAQEQVSAKGLYYEKDSVRLGAKFCIRLVKDEETREVPTTMVFRSGDRVQFVLEANQDCYVYILNRTFSGNPDDLFKDRQRGVVLDEDKVTQGTEYTVLFPTHEAGTNNNLCNNKEHVLPHTGSFVFDERTGIERLYIVLSKGKVDPIDVIISRLAEETEDEAAEKMEETAEPPVAEATEATPNSEDQEVLKQLIGDLKDEMTLELGGEKDHYGYAVEGKGIRYQPPKDPKEKKPVLIVINLEHK